MDNNNTSIENLFIVDYNKMHPCDLVFSTTDELFSRVIRATTNSKYSHVLLYLQQTLIHSTPKGTFTTNPQRYHRSSHYISTFRYKYKLTQTQINEIQNYARGQVGALYTKTQAGLSRLEIAPQNPTKQFCSRLVAQSYAKAGIQLVKNPNTCTPQDIINSNLFEQTNLLTPVTQSILDICKKDDIPFLNQIATYKWLNKARQHARDLKIKTEIVKQGDVLDFINKHPETDDAITSFLIESGYLDQYKLDLTANPHRYDKLLMETFVHHTTKVFGTPHIILIHKFRLFSNDLPRLFGELETYNKHKKQKYATCISKLYYNIILQRNTALHTIKHAAINIFSLGEMKKLQHILATSEGHLHQKYAHLALI